MEKVKLRKVTKFLTAEMAERSGMHQCLVCTCGGLEVTYYVNVNGEPVPLDGKRQTGMAGADYHQALTAIENALQTHPTAKHAGVRQRPRTAQFAAKAWEEFQAEMAEIGRNEEWY